MTPDRLLRISAGRVAAALVVAWCVFPVCGQVFRGYYSSGVLEYEEKTRRSGVVRAYYPDSTLRCTISYRRKQLDGTTTEYYENGKVKLEIEYEDNARRGMAKFYYETGMLMAKIYYRRNAREGKARFYDENGMPLSTVQQERDAMERLKQFIGGQTLLPRIENPEG